jgi:hypothetical protein
VAGSLPELIAFYEDHAAEREKFAIFAIHDDQVKSFRELDRKLADVKKKYWAGKSLPCPILLDGEKKTHELYGVNGWPTGVLIDPEGKVVSEASLAALEAKLTPLSAAQRWAHHRDLQKNVFWTFEPKENTLESFARILERWTDGPVRIDTDAVKVAGLATDTPLPGVIIGSPLTLRSIDELLLAPHGLGIAPSTNGQSLEIKGRLQAKEKPSYFQKLHNADLEKRLNGAAATGGEEPPKPLTIDNQSVLEALKLIGREYNLPVAIEAKAMQLGQINAEAKVSGTINPDRLRKSLLKLFEPLGLTVEVRQEVVLLVPAKR